MSVKRFETGSRFWRIGLENGQSRNWPVRTRLDNGFAGAWRLGFYNGFAGAWRLGFCNGFAGALGSHVGLAVVVSMRFGMAMSIVVNLNVVVNFIMVVTMMMPVVAGTLSQREGCGGQDGNGGEYLIHVCCRLELS